MGNRMVIGHMTNDVTWPPKRPRS